MVVYEWEIFSISIEKQQDIINAGYRIFSQNSYHHSPINEIVGVAGIN